MKVENAIEILHPSTTMDALTQIEYFAGFNGKQAKVRAVEEACLIACDSLKRDKAVRPIHVRYKIKSTGRNIHHMYCGVCGKYNQRVASGDKYCRECGTKIDWRKQE